MEILVLFGCFIIILILSVLLHEFFHVFILRLFFKTGRIEVKWLQFIFDRSKGKIHIEISGKTEYEVDTRNLRFSTKLPKRFESILSAAGGLGSAIVSATIGIFFLLNPLSGNLELIWIPFLLNSGRELIKGILELISIRKKVEPTRE